MKYTNDEFDEKIRKRHYCITVYVLPVLLVISCWLIIYTAIKANFIEKEIILYFLLSLFPGYLLQNYFINHWLKIPDTTFHYVKNIRDTSKFSVIEPNLYDAEYSNSTIMLPNEFFGGILFLIIGIVQIHKKDYSKFGCLLFCVVGIFSIYNSIKTVFKNHPKLKLAKNGLWTRKLGFVNWDDIRFATVNAEQSGEDTSLFLEIYLKDTKYDEAMLPDERLNIKNLENSFEIENLINRLISEFSEAKLKAVE